MRWMEDVPQPLRELGGAMRDARHAFDSRRYTAIGLAAAFGIVIGFAIAHGVHALQDLPGEDDDGWGHFV